MICRIAFAVVGDNVLDWSVFLIGIETIIDLIAAGRTETHLVAGLKRREES